MTRRIRRELRTVRVMIAMYCRSHHGIKRELCDDCSALWDHVQKRVENCPFGTVKPTCLNCTVHCFNHAMREQIRSVMRYAGPRMLRRHPVLTLFHIMDGRKPAPKNRQ